MRAEFEIFAGPLQGKRLVLDSSKAIKVGRSDESDFTVTGDKRMSGRHFALKLDGEKCLLRDLNSRNGTLVNGKKFDGKYALKTGDVIEAGQSQFRVVLVYDPLSIGSGAPVAAKEADESTETPGAMEAPAPGGEEPSKPSQPAPAAPSADKPQKSGPFPPKSVTAEMAPAPPPSPGVDLGVSQEIPGESPYVSKNCESGVTLFEPPPDGAEEKLVGPIPLAKKLAEECPMYLLVDLTKIGAPLPEKLREPQFLFDWLPAEVARGTSPLLFAPGGPADLWRLMEKGWGKRGIVCLYTRDKPDQVLTHWRKAIRGGPNAAGTGVPDSFYGVCWPQILASVLEHSDDRSQTEFLMKGTEAILVESKPPQRWKIFSGEGFGAALESLGLVPAGSETEDNGH